MALAQTRQIFFGSVSFLVFWVSAVFPSCKLLPLGRTGGAISGAVLTVVLQVASPASAYASVDLSILGLLFGTMVVSLYLEKADMFKYLGSALSWKCRGGKDLLCRICVLSAISSALFTNDTSCIILTEFALKLCRQKGLHPKPFLIALATSANIGSSATPIGNPQNLVIAIQSRISFGQFLLGLLPSVLVGFTINTLLLLVIYWKQLSPIEDEDDQSGSAGESEGKFGSKVVLSTDTSNLEKIRSVATFDSKSLLNSAVSLIEIGPGCFNHDERSSCEVTCGSGQQRVVQDEHTLVKDLDSLQVVVADDKQAINGLGESPSRPGSSFVKVPESCPRVCSRSMYKSYTRCMQWRWKPWKKCVVYFVTAGMLAALLYGLDLSWSALTAAAVLMALDFKDAGPVLDKVSYALLVFFTGMFITVDGFSKTGIPGTFWQVVEPHAHVDNATGLIVLTLVVMVLSNIVSNVPTVLLLGSLVAASAVLDGTNVKAAWLILAWTSTIAGNLTLLGSAANLIVCEQARKAQLLGYELTFWNHLMFGLPSTLLVAVAGLYLITSR